MYLPDNFKLKSLSRDFIFTLLHSKKLDLYKDLKESAKKLDEVNKTKIFEKASIVVDDEIYNEIMNIPILTVNFYNNCIGIRSK